MIEEEQNSKKDPNHLNPEEPGDANRDGIDSGLRIKNFDVIESESEPEEDLSDLSVRIQIFTCFWATGMFGNLDTGVIPTTLHLIMDELGTTQG